MLSNQELASNLPKCVATQIHCNISSKATATGSIKVFYVPALKLSNEKR